MIAKIEFNIKNTYAISDLIPEDISVLSFQLSNAVNKPITVVIHNNGKTEIKDKVTDANGKFSIQAKTQSNIVADIPTSWFSHYQGTFYFKIYVDGVALPIQTIFEGIRFKFQDINGFSPEYIINISGNTVVVPPVGVSVIGEIIIGSYIIL